MDRQKTALHFLSLGYRDYIASRVLLHNQLIIQGITLSSSSIEKYLKAVLALHGITLRVHLDNIPKIQQALAECYTDFTNKFDKRFLDILSKAYKIRYYNNLQEPITIGFFVNQFIGELDFAIYFMEFKVFQGISKEDGSHVTTEYKRAIEEKVEHLYLNNYILKGISKKEHMEQEDNGFAIYLDASKPFGELTVLGTGIRNDYDGRMYEITFKLN